MFQSLFFWNGLWDSTVKTATGVNQGFNPCFSGMAFGTIRYRVKVHGLTGFNPCFSGMAFGTPRHALPVREANTVSILVFLEWPLGRRASAL